MHGFYLLLKNLFSLDAPATLVISACISGVIFVYFSFRTADVLGRTMFEKACLAIAMNANGLDSLATSWYGKAFEKYPEDPRMALNYAGVLAKAGSVDSAITVLQKTIAVFPFYFKAYPLLFEINRKKNDYMEAMHTAYLMYNAYISKPPELPVNIPQSELRWAFMELAVFLARSGTPDRAETIMNTVIMFSKNDAEAVDLLEKIRAGEAF
jgi:tetratricopeptide (TPR) repeat protein